MPPLSAAQHFKQWAEGQDEKKLMWIIGGVLAGLVLLQWKSQPFLLRSVLAASAITTGLYKGGSLSSLKKFFKTWAYVLFMLGVWHYAHLVFGSGWWGVLFVLVAATLYKLYRMRAFVRAWWTWYKARLRAAWSGDLRKTEKSFSERVRDAAMGKER